VQRRGIHRKMQRRSHWNGPPIAPMGPARSPTRAPVIPTRLPAGSSSISMPIRRSISRAIGMPSSAVFSATDRRSSMSMRPCGGFRLREARPPTGARSCKPTFDPLMSGNCELGCGLRRRTKTNTEGGAGRFEKPAPAARAAAPEAHESLIGRKTVEEEPLTGLSFRRPPCGGWVEHAGREMVPATSHVPATKSGEDAILPSFGGWQLLFGPRIRYERNGLFL